MKKIVLLCCCIASIGILMSGCSKEPSRDDKHQQYIDDPSEHNRGGGDVNI
ncbi:MAG: hypothetical protein Q4A08_08135 [Bacteroidales bacterium]|nr:hypothetical protein [Bacteroidales bacterium]